MESRPTALESELKAGGGEQRSLGRLLLHGGSTLGVATALERGLGFVAAVLAARFAGPQTFGAYSIALSTAGTVSAYAGAGIGTTANRFGGQYPRESAGYRGFLRAVALLGVGSAAIAAAVMFAGAGPLARALLRNESLTPVLRLGALSAAGLILFDACRGLLIGQLRYRSLLLLSAVLGGGLLVALPIAARVSAEAMVGGQAGVLLLAVGICALFARRLGLTPLASPAGADSGPRVGSVLVFGLAQFAAVIGINLASWWLALLVARQDTSLHEMGLYAVANQLRGLAALAPGLLAQVSYPLLTDHSGRGYGGADRVTLVNTYVLAALALGLGGSAIVALPWLLTVVYGASYGAAELAAVLALATAVVHMASVPVGNRLSIVALRSLAVINAIWALLVIAVGSLLVPRGGAAGAAATFLVAHSLSFLLALIALQRVGALPRHMAGAAVATLFGAWSLAILAYWRVAAPERGLALTVGLGVILLSALVGLGFTGLRAARESVKR